MLIDLSLSDIFSGITPAIQEIFSTFAWLLFFLSGLLLIFPILRVIIMLVPTIKKKTYKEPPELARYPSLKTLKKQHKIS